MTPPASPPSAAAQPPAPWQVVVPFPIPALDYAAPHGHAGAVPVGCRVLVPWRGELIVALVVGEGEGRSSHRLREAVHVLDDEEGPWVPPATVQAVTSWARDARLPAGLVWCDLLGVGWSVRLDHRVRAVPGADLSAFARHVPTPLWTDAAGFAPALLDAIREQGLLEETFRPLPRMRGVVRARPLAAVPAAARTVTVLRALPEPPPTLTPKGRVAWAWLAGHGPQDSLSAWARGAGVSAGVVTNVLNAGGAQYVQVEAPPPPAWRWLAEHGPVDSLSAWVRGAAAHGVPLS
ncbi:MAG: primosomal protein N', partial [Deinococcota bacterium]